MLAAAHRPVDGGGVLARAGSGGFRGLGSVTPRPADALIIVDPQNDFCPGGSLAVADGDAIMADIAALATGFAHVVVTQDWHPAGHGSFASSHPGAAQGATLAPASWNVIRLDVRG